MPEIRSDYSAQSISAPPNPMFLRCLARVAAMMPTCHHAIDLGCGQLRHLEMLRRHYARVTLVDTTVQFERLHRMGSRLLTIPDYVASSRVRAHSAVECVSSERLAAARALGACVAFCTAVFDVVLPKTRAEVIRLAHRHLGRGGLFVVVVPRNDSSILKRCSAENAHRDGHVFGHHGVHTFFRNFADSGALSDSISSGGFELLEDISVYRQVGLILRRP